VTFKAKEEHHDLRTGTLIAYWLASAGASLAMAMPAWTKKSPLAKENRIETIGI